MPGPRPIASEQGPGVAGESPGPQARHSPRRKRGGGCSGKNRKREDTFASVAEMFIQRHVAGCIPTMPRARSDTRWSRCGGIGRSPASPGVTSSTWSKGIVSRNGKGRGLTAASWIPRETGGDPLLGDPAYEAVRKREYVHVPRIVSITPPAEVDHFDESDFSPKAMKTREEKGYVETKKVLGEKARRA
jgi:hypothetical protein